MTKSKSRLLNSALKKIVQRLLTVICLLSILIAHAQENQRKVSGTSFTFNIGSVPLMVNYFSSPEIDRQNTEITRLVIVIHDVLRDPFTFHKNMRVAADKSGSSESTLIIAPGFITEADFVANKDILTSDHVFWTANGWKEGDTSIMNSVVNKRAAQISSFEVLDSIIWRTLNSAQFPNIKTIVVAGHSAGGQFVNRYSGGSLIHERVKDTFGIEIKYLVSAPGTYTYLTPERPLLDGSGKYYIPKDTGCAWYNIYRYGIRNFNHYMATKGEEKYKAQFGLRNVAYFVGALDNDPTASDLDKTCAANLQGRHRKERAELFVEYLYHLYGKRWKLTIVPDTGHDHAKVFSSDYAMEWLFR